MPGTQGLSTRAMTAHRAQGLTMKPTLRRAFLSPTSNVLITSEKGIINCYLLTATADLPLVARLIEAANAAGGAHNIYFADVGDGTEAGKREKRLRIIVPPHALLSLVETLLEMEGWKLMTITADERFSGVLGAIIVGAGGHEVFDV
ncbi:hypothetical protein FPV67DRAFT_1454422 [Lyophyllum atratum]|nr:hypothetical protein FPV67DRAFT_1454422 [Lyophyllum atratum]